MPTPPAPPTRRDDIVDVLHGVSIPDPYRWLEEGADAEVTAWVEAQNTRTRQALDARPDRSKWHERLVELMCVPVAGGAVRRGDRLFALERTGGAQQFSLVVRSLAQVGDPARVLVDPAVASDDAATAIDWYYPSPDGAFVAYGQSEAGSEKSVLRVLDVERLVHLDDEIPNTRGCSVEWQPDGRGFWYTRYPEGDQYNRKVYTHRLGDDWLDDELLWGALPQPTSWPWIDAVSPDGRYLVIGCQNGWSQHDLHLHDTLTSAWIPLVEGEEAINSAAFWDDRVVVNTTFDAPRGRVVSAPLSTPNVEHWETLIPERDVVVSAVSVASDGLYVVASDRGIDVVERYDQSGRLQATLDGLGPVSIAGMSSRVAEPGVVITITGFDRPTGIGLWDGSGEAPTLVSPEFVPTASDAGTDVATPFPGGALTVGYHRYRSDDGTEVGLFLMHRSDVVPSPATPLVLYGYGGFGITMAPAWTPRWAAWCAAGGAVAIAALRGGGEEGEGWHHAGRRDNKQNVFDDFHAAARHVVEQGWTSPEHLGIAGGSNGGLLVGAALTQHPEMYRAVWCAVPLLDMVRFPRFLIAKLWTDEYGDPEVADEFAWLVGYSPYHRVVDGEHYPAVLFTTAESDTRVDPLHARKMAALLQNTSRSADLRPVFLYQEARAGHGVGKPLGKQADEAADALTFLAWQLGLDAP